jgi:hypothetical protein
VTIIKYKKSNVEPSILLLFLISVLLILIGVANITDDAQVRTYDLTSIFSGLGLALVTYQFKKSKGKNEKNSSHQSSSKSKKFL